MEKPGKALGKVFGKSFMTVKKVDHIDAYMYFSLPH